MSEEMNQVEVKNFEVGDKVKGQVTKVEEKQVIVDLADSKLDGIIPISELSSLHIEKASDAVSEGDELELEVLKVEEEALILSKRKVDAGKSWETLEKKFNDGEVFEAEIKDVVKGGLVVDLGVRGFVPASLVEAHFVEDFTDYKGKTMTFKIVELDKDKNRLILSHRAVIEEEKGKQKHQVLESLQAGQVLDGTVQRITDFGAFVDIGGIDGLVHISQLSYEHVEKPSDVVEEGQKVKVKVLSVDRDNERISLSIKETLPGPWDNISEKAPKGSTLEGTVKRLVSYGAFVEVFPGVEGLVHISQIAHKHIGTPHEVLSEGQEIKVKVLDVNEQDQRLSLSIKDLLEKEQEEVTDYELPEENKGFSLGDMIGDQLKNLKK
ncbi:MULTISPECIES: 30S ribosomal protein S1 [Cytobacillus]|jgi:small subunit ribosomal protein S1|uniref:30S ribosomal protein S1 n=3 Tax=Cytobacillus TaxID=2675230 RepID=A0A160MDU1_9BACI|nr:MULTISPECIES: 30S ribosomal protein S1 [Cytobacillus]EFV77604.1 30S ribosomal protein S1 [Bacillus sp. 2_A_57_CT2]MBY0154689.1 30S ribosomal protein S1 [Cytobacillus firmus]AND41257.1 30S ribosomal protein S1 [Cytobacillus oceanisediminis 2691]MBU8771375.1 30S ribosomal protein S1 [Cytobacillus oceanisediminis]MCM3393908.1 30S ribosomal protein S1 [Cytobacillus oceanisediminis]